MPDRSRKKEAEELDPNERAKSIVDRIIKEAEPEPDEEARKKAAAILGRRGGLKGGPARARKLTSAQRKEIAQKAAKARWDKEKGQE